MHVRPPKISFIRECQDPPGGPYLNSGNLCPLLLPRWGLGAPSAQRRVSTWLRKRKRLSTVCLSYSPFNRHINPPPQLDLHGMIPHSLEIPSLPLLFFPQFLFSSAPLNYFFRSSSSTHCSSWNHSLVRSFNISSLFPDSLFFHIENLADSPNVRPYRWA